MEVVVTLTSRSHQAVSMPPTVLLTVSAPSTRTFASTSSVLSQTVDLPIWPRWVTSVMFSRTRRTVSMTSSDATRPSLEIIRTCLTSACLSPRASYRMMTLERFSVTQPLSCNESTKTWFTGRVPLTWGMLCSKTPGLQATNSTMKRPTRANTIGCRNPRATLIWSEQPANVVLSEFRNLKDAKVACCQKLDLCNRLN